MWLVILRNCLHFLSIKWEENHSSHFGTSNRTKRFRADGINSTAEQGQYNLKDWQPALNVMLSMTSTFVLRKGIF